MTQPSLNFLTPLEAKQFADRRAWEAQRLARLLDPKEYNKVDTAALKQQIDDKNAVLDKARHEAAANAEKLKAMDDHLKQLEAATLAAQKESLRELADFQKTVQTRESRREFDLSGFQGVSAREGDDDSQLSVSGAQKFAGEDLGKPHRVRAQQRELSEWSAAAIARKEAEMKRDKEQADTFSKSLVDMDSYRVKLEDQYDASRKATAKALADFNLAQVEAKREREKARLLAEQQDNLEEIQNNLASAQLNENPEVGRSYIAPNRVRPDHFKGMSAGEKQAVLRELDAQLELKATTRAEEKAADELTNSSIRHSHLVGLAHDVQVEQARAAMRKSVIAENQELAKSQTMQRSHMQEVFSNSVESSFFDKFQTTAR